MNLQRLCLVAVFALLILAGRTAIAALTGEYLFEEGSGTTAVDSSGLNRDGTLTGTMGAPDYVDGLYLGSTSALRFNFDDGTGLYDPTLGQRVLLPPNTAFVQNAPAVTLMAWVRPDVTGAVSSIVGVSESTGGTRAVLQFIDNGQWRILGRRADGGSNSNYVSSGANPLTVTAGERYFVAGILDYENADIRLYVNGEQHTGGAFANNLGGPGNSVDMTNATAMIGRSSIDTEPWRGLIDGVRIFDHALSAQEIMDIYWAEASVDLCIPGDFNCNGAVENADLTLLLNNWGAAVPPTPDGWTGGAPTAPAIDNDELTALLNNWGNTAGGGSAVAAPEPATWMLLVLAGIAMCCRRQKFIS